MIDFDLEERAAIMEYDGGMTREAAEKAAARKDRGLRPYQAIAVASVKQNIARGVKRNILYMPTGSGKTETAAEIIKMAVDKRKRVAFVCHRIELVKQASERFFKLGISHGVIQGENSHSEWSSVVVASIQTVASRGIEDMDLIIVDECFARETVISTPHGPKNIDVVRCGDIVYTAAGVGTVEAVSARPATDLYTLEFDDGTVTTCTGNHPFFTERGWTKAAKLEVGACTFSVQAVRLLWERVSALDEIQRGRKDGRLSSGSVLDQAGRLLNILFKEIKQPNEQSSKSIEDEGSVERNKTQTYQAWRQRAITALSTVGASTCSWRGVGIRGVDSNQDEASWNWLSNLLQNRHSQQRKDDWDRVGRGESRQFGKTGAGHQENGFPYFPRLVSISRVKSKSPRTVFNLQVSGHPSYFADGKLVHNCHAVAGSKDYKSLFDKHNTIPIVGLSATPFSKGLGLMFDGLVIGATIRDLIDDGYLVDCEIYAPGEPDLSQVKIVAGDYQQDQLGEAVDKPELVGDIVTHWLKLARGQQTICFATNILHSKHICDEFEKHNIPAGHIDAYTPAEERKRSVAHEAKEKLPKMCVKCSYMKPVGVHQCPKCGFLPERKSEIETADGELVRLERKKKREMTTEQKADFYGELKTYAAEKGYKSGWAANKFKERTGVWPNHYKDVPPKYCSVNTRDWIKSRQIAFAKARDNG
ncbi:MAG: hypothetical protein EBR82_52535 [Caulobacteraceae bacterium]|nr:hypothetical protein [Caulobacteraceae bacterium]